MKKTRCHGHCCRCFCLSVTIEDLQKNPEKFQDGQVILDMIIPLGRISEQELRVKFGDHRHSGDEVKERYTCRHLKENGDCSIYENRPGMCSAYNTGKSQCEWTACENKAFSV